MMRRCAVLDGGGGGDEKKGGKKHSKKDKKKRKRKKKKDKKEARRARKEAKKTKKDAPEKEEEEEDTEESEGGQKKKKYRANGTRKPHRTGKPPKTPDVPHAIIILKQVVSYVQPLLHAGVAKFAGVLCTGNGRRLRQDACEESHRLPRRVVCGLVRSSEKSSRHHRKCAPPLFAQHRACLRLFSSWVVQLRWTTSSTNRIHSGGRRRRGLPRRRSSTKQW